MKPHLMNCCMVLGLSAGVAGSAAAELGTLTVDLSSCWDQAMPLANPHKGWYHHFYDNGMRKYLPPRDEDLLDFPGMDHIYLRLAWAYLEPQEGEFHWEVLDNVIEKWTALGLGVAFRISCRETGRDPVEQRFATPQWVISAGAKGEHWARNKEPGDPELPWEPIYDDPVFLEKLEAFIAAFAERYDGKPWLRYVDVGSLGDWGEGHTSSGSGKRYDWRARIKHLEIHARTFKRTLVVVTDDFVREAGTDEGRAKLHQYVLENGMSYRDDSILVDYWIGRDGKTFSVANPEYFQGVYRDHPTVLELQHLYAYAAEGKWEGRAGTPLAKFKATGPEFVRGALRLLRATYIGYHGQAHEWLALAGNPALTHELLNLCGYWFFPHAITYSEQLGHGDELAVSIVWQNRGVAPAYHPYLIQFRVGGPNGGVVETAANNQRWAPGDLGEVAPIFTERYATSLPQGLPPREHDLSFRLYSPQENRPVLLPLPLSMVDDGFYTVGKLTVR